MESIDVAIIGGGPAGLFAAEAAANHGARVVLFEANPAVGRKFLVAGKGGMNLTHGEDSNRMASRYSGPGQPNSFWENLLDEFSAADARHWASCLGEETFQSSSGRVYLKSPKSAPLLRKWMARLRDSGVTLMTHHRWCGISASPPWTLDFENGRQYHAATVVFALGGASWPKTGSDGTWLSHFSANGIHCRPFEPANCGWNYTWPNEILPSIEEKPLKNLVVSAEATSISGELMITRHGLEGGPLYALGPVLRRMPQPTLSIDLKPTFSVEQLTRKMESVRRDFVNAAAERWKLPDPACVVFSQSHWADAASLAYAVKHWTLPLSGPRPIAEAISSAGGVCWDSIDPDTLMLHRMPGVFVAGEMMDWEAPTGGYLLQGCLATGRRAGIAAASFGFPGREISCRTISQ